MHPLNECLKFSDEMVKARKANNHPHIKKDDSAIIERMQITGIKMAIKKLKKLIHEKHHISSKSFV